MTNYDPGRQPNRPSFTGFGGGWIIFVIIILVILGFSWDGSYWRGHPGVNALARSTANAAHNANTTTNNTNAAPASAQNKP